MRTHRWRQRIYEKASWRNSTKQNHEDHIAGSGIDSLNHYNLVLKFLPMQAMKIPDAKAAVGKDWKTGENTRIATHESQKQKRGDRWSKEWGQNSTVCVAPRWHCVRWFRLIRSMCRARFISVTNDGSKSNGCHSKATRMRRTRRLRWKMLHRYCTFQSQNVQIYGYVYRNTNSSNRGPVWKIQSFVLSEICTVILWQDYYGEDNWRKFSWNTDRKKFQFGHVHS